VVGVNFAVGVAVGAIVIIGVGTLVGAGVGEIGTTLVVSKLIDRLMTIRNRRAAITNSNFLTPKMYSLRQQMSINLTSVE
jgi:hypothetical protein